MRMAYGSLSYVGWVWFGWGLGDMDGFFLRLYMHFGARGVLGKDIWSGAHSYDKRMARVCL